MFDFIGYFNKLVRIIYLLMFLSILALVYLHFFRPVEATNLEQVSSTYENSNYTLYVYHSIPNLNLRTSNDFKHNDNISGQLERGTLFYFSDKEYKNRIVRSWNFPEDNVNEYVYVRIHLFEQGRIDRFALVTSYMYLLKEDEELSRENILSKSDYLHERSIPFVDYISWTLKENGWDKKDPFQFGNFGYVGDGLYYTTLSEDTNLYNRKGKLIGSLEEGTKVLSSFNLPFATGYEDESKIRIVGYILKGSEVIESIGTYFIDGGTIETTAES